MGLRQELNSLFLGQISSGNIRQAIYPNAAVMGAGLAIIPIASDNMAAAWDFPAAALAIQIVALGGLTNPTWLAGCHMQTPAVGAHYGILQVGVGNAAGNAMVTALAEFPYHCLLFVEVEGRDLNVPCFYPIRIGGSPSLVGRIKKSTGASLAGISVYLIHLEAVGT